MLFNTTFMAPIMLEVFPLKLLLIIISFSDIIVHQIVTFSFLSFSQPVANIVQYTGALKQFLEMTDSWHIQAEIAAICLLTRWLTSLEIWNNAKMKENRMTPDSLGTKACLR